MSMRIISVLIAAVAAGVVVAAATGRTQAKVPVIRYVDDKFGPILATPGKRALYYWNAEKRAKGKIKCTGSCAKAWPPLYAKGAVRTHIAGIKGAFGTVRRPDGRRQVTFNGLAVYTYAHESPTQVLCNNVDGWFVVRLR
jgi:predicted lipoprotein with Yx(FWY)xxD motif